MPRNALGRGLERSFGSLSPRLRRIRHRLMHHSQWCRKRPAREVAHPGLQQVDIDLIDPSPLPVASHAVS